VATLRLFAQAREVAGTSSDTVDGGTVDEVIANAVARYGQNFADLLPTCRIWLNGEAVPTSTAEGDKEEVAVLPPVSGGFE
jgi:molybdopterin converting factor small subunit